jgi:hypothetical protein
MFEHKHPFGVEHCRALFVHVDKLQPNWQVALAFGDCEINGHAGYDRKDGTAQRRKRAEQAVLAAVRVAPDMVANQ